jgi:hypothetical protein
MIFILCFPRSVAWEYFDIYGISTGDSRAEQSAHFPEVSTINMLGDLYRPWTRIPRYVCFPEIGKFELATKGETGLSFENRLTVLVA